MRLLSTISAVLFLAGSPFFSGCGKGGDTQRLIGAGASFPYPLYSKMFLAYKEKKGIEVNYQSIGSGGGVRQLEQKTINFGATDAFIKDKEMKKFSKNIVHIPMALGAVVAVYNIPDLKEQLKLSGEITAKIFLGEIQKWNDPAIIALNPKVKLPDHKITVARRSDGSGTTYVFSEFLAKSYPVWKEKVGVGKSLSWPVGVGGKGNPGVAGLVKQTPYSIGYVEVAYAEQNKMSFALMRNKKGNFIEPTLESISLSANVNLPDDLRVSLVDTASEKGYPITTFTWVIVYQDLAENIDNPKSAKEVKNLIRWMIHEGQQYNEKLLYGKLPKAAVEKAEKLIGSLTYKGKTI